MISEGVALRKLRLMKHVRNSERKSEQIVETPVPQGAEHFLAPFVALPLPQNLKEGVEVEAGSSCANFRRHF